MKKVYKKKERKREIEREREKVKRGLMNFPNLISLDSPYLRSVKLPSSYFRELKVSPNLFLLLNTKNGPTKSLPM